METLTLTLSLSKGEGGRRRCFNSLPSRISPCKWP